MKLENFFINYLNQISKIIFTFVVLFSFSGCSSKEKDEVINRKSDSIIILQTDLLNLQKEFAEMKLNYENVKTENDNLKKELNEMKITLEKEKEGPSKEIILKDLDKYLLERGAPFMNAIRETYSAKVVGNSKSSNDDIYIAQCQGKTSFSANDMMGYSYISYDFQAEVKYQKFGGEWQLKDVDIIKQTNVVRVKSFFPCKIEKWLSCIFLRNKVFCVCICYFVPSEKTSHVS